MFNFFKKKSPAPDDALKDQPIEAEHLSSQTEAPEHSIPTVQQPLTPDQILEVDAYWAALSARVAEASIDVSVQNVATGETQVHLPTDDHTATEAHAATDDPAAKEDHAAKEIPSAVQDHLATANLAQIEDPSAPGVPENSPADELAPVKTSWLTKLRGGLSKTGQSISTLFVGVKVDEALFEELETALIMADAGVEATGQLLTSLRARVKRDRINDAEAVKQALREVLTDHLKVLEKPFVVGQVKTLVVMITGVNGAGKTTSIGKLAHAFQQRGAKVLLAAGDTFRAAARQQLMEWGARNNVDVITQEGADPAAVAFDAVHAGRARGADVVMVDTAGRLPTQLHLMDELKKIRRVIGKADPTAPHEVLLVVDGNTGQNVLSQIRTFDAAIGLTGLIVTKLDGTAKGGTLAAVAAGSQGVRPVPVYWIGVGERMEDLQPFVASEFAAAVVG
jgi:fused signal recognition particle receptor